ncbi:hypothetical protein [Diaphorobacter ruginosibacter]|uniref:hypothetical protein n=1 Tax=Diaphorobacter ruginosibacter TaxID=1715720 RepID=UPI00333FD2D2
MEMIKKANDPYLDALGSTEVASMARMIGELKLDVRELAGDLFTSPLDELEKNQFKAVQEAQVRALGILPDPTDEWKKSLQGPDPASAVNDYIGAARILGTSGLNSYTISSELAKEQHDAILGMNRSTLEAQTPNDQSLLQSIKESSIGDFDFEAAEEEWKRNENRKRLDGSMEIHQHIQRQHAEHTQRQRDTAENTRRAAEATERSIEIALQNADEAKLAASDAKRESRFQRRLAVAGFIVAAVSLVVAVAALWVSVIPLLKQ